MDKDYAFSQNYNYRRSALVLSIRLITLIPREGTETQRVSNSISRLMSVDYPYSPRGDGNLDRFAWVTMGIRELITPIPREGTSSMLIS